MSNCNGAKENKVAPYLSAKLERSLSLTSQSSSPARSLAPHPSSRRQVDDPADDDLRQVHARPETTMASINNGASAAYTYI